MTVVIVTEGDEFDAVPSLLSTPWMSKKTLGVLVKPGFVPAIDVVHVPGGCFFDHISVHYHELRRRVLNSFDELVLVRLEKGSGLAGGVGSDVLQFYVPEIPGPLKTRILQ
jgi:hypothetical protein